MFLELSYHAVAWILVPFGSFVPEGAKAAEKPEVVFGIADVVRAARTSRGRDWRQV